jgi:selenocysteine lyase/cysteine desulfurase
VSLHIDDLVSLISSKTRFIAFTACSNILGELADVEAIVKAARIAASQHGTRKTELCVDCVAFAPHRRIDVQKFGVDFAVFSYYKVK